MSVSNPNASLQAKSKEVRRKRKLSSSLSSRIVLRHQQGQPKRCKLNIQENTFGNVQSSVEHLARELESKLDARYPSFVKTMLKSHVSGPFWMGLPAPFCRKHLPQIDTFITLETQSKNLYKAKYLVRKGGLSGGWRRFAVSERLLVGNVLVFHLLSTNRFKVYIIRENNLTEVVDGALFPLKLDTSMEQSDRGKLTKSSKGKELVEVRERIMQPPDNSRSNIRNKESSRAVDCFQTNEVAVRINAISTLNNFNVVINDLLKDFKLPEHVKWNYYKLCCSQNALLHADLPSRMNHILISGIIIETVSVADSLRECELSTFKDDSVVWDKTLNALELLGMNVGFLRARLHCLRRIAHDPEVATFRQKCRELYSENARTKDEIRSLLARLAEMKQAHSKRALDIANLKSKIENHEIEFQNQVQVPW